MGDKYIALCANPVGTKLLLVSNEVLERIGQTRILLNNILLRRADWICCILRIKLPPWCLWGTDNGSESSRKKNTAPWCSEKQEKILGAKGENKNEIDENDSLSIEHKEETQTHTHIYPLNFSCCKTFQ